ncbi:MAG: tRNA lysidine(34) synthetase TilS [Anaerolineales bacterium]|nr:tRNA lysidine(34) synthetase TilS [Anaerolineales bacterium]
MELERIQSFIQDNCLLQREKPVLAAVSGGPDSLCMLDVLWRLGYPLVVAHLDHRLRPSSAQEAQSVRRAAQERSAPFVLGVEDVRAFAAANGLSIEEAAREARYRFLFEQASLQGAQAVAVGHTADDQVETVLMHLLRGAGLPGLKGMSYRALPNAWSQQTPLVRPLLGMWRQEVLDYLEEHNLQPTLDESNLDQRFYRNRLRHELIPYLESYNPRLRQAIWRMSEALGQDHRSLEELVDAAWSDSIQRVGTGYVAYKVQQLKEQSLGLQRRLLRRAIGRLRPGLRDVDYPAMERATAFIEKPSRSSQIDLVAGLRLYLDGDILYLAAWEADLPVDNWPQIAPGAVIDLPVPGAAVLPGGWQLQAAIVEHVQSAQPPTWTDADPYQAWLDLERLQTPLCIRARRAGDRFQPLGMGGHSVKISNFMINVKLPRRARDGWPLALSGEQIAWLPGFRPAQPFCLSEKTRRAVRLKLVWSE